MKKLLLVVIVTLSLASSGCIPLVAGGLIGAAAVKAGSSQRRLKLTEMQRRSIESKEIEGTREDVIRSTVTVFQDKGFVVQTSDYQAGIISGAIEKPFLQVTVSVEGFTSNRTKIRVTIKDKRGIIEDEKLYLKMFDDIQAEVFRRVNLNR